MKLADFLNRIKIDSEKHPYLSGRFLLTMGPLVVSFQKISGIEGKREIEYYNEGGQNDYPHVFIKQKTSPNTLTFEKGYGLFNPIMTAMSLPKAVITKVPGTIIILDSAKNIVRMFVFIGTFPIEWKMSDLDAKDGNIIIDTVTIVHGGLKEIPVSLISKGLNALGIDFL